MTDTHQIILIVEDSTTMCHLYRMALGDRESTELLFAGNGVEGLDQLARVPNVALMIVDINMPQMDGLEFLRRVRADLGVTNIPAIVISTEGDESDRAAAREVGASAYLRKPWTPSQLTRTIDSLLRPTGVQ